VTRTIYTALGLRRAAKEDFERLEAKVDSLLATGRGASAPQPSTITQDDVDGLAYRLADGLIPLPRGAQLGMVTDIHPAIPGVRNYLTTTERATGLSLRDGRYYTVRELAELGCDGSVAFWRKLGAWT
jgi:hypothetical protein